MQNLYSKNYKTLFEEIKEDLNRWNYIPCSRIGRFPVMLTILLILRVSAIPTKITVGFFAGIDKS